jgi:putative membrane protein
VEEPGRAPFRRLSPLTPVLKGWTWLAAFGAYTAQQYSRDVGARTYLLGAAILLPLAIVYGTASWWFTRYRIESGDLRVETGLLFRQSRRVRLDRLQAVDVVRPLLGRALGLAELRLEVAGGTSAEAPLAYLSEGEAQQLRAELLALAAGLAPDEPEAPERLLVEVPALRLLASVLLRPFFLVSIAAVTVTVASAGMASYPVVGLVPLVLGMGGPFYTAFVRQFGFTVAVSPDGLRLRAGLLDTRSQTVPPGRVQAVRMSRPLLWRFFTDWVRLDVNVAGYAGASGTSSLLLPAGPPAEAAEILALAVPGLDLAGIPLTPAPARARWIRPLGRRGLAAGADDVGFVARSGVLRQETVIVPHGKAQSLRSTQGPYQRRLGLATIHVDSTPGPARGRAAHRDAGDAARMLAGLVGLTGQARAGASPDRWMATAPRAPRNDATSA